MHRNRCTQPDRYTATLPSHAPVRPSSGECNPPGTRPRKPYPSSRCRVLRSRRSWYLYLLKLCGSGKRTTDSSKNHAPGTANRERFSVRKLTEVSLRHSPETPQPRLPASSLSSLG